MSEVSEPEQRGWFKVWFSGEVVAHGIGPYSTCKAEADRYAMIYSQNHTVKVRVARIGMRKSA